MPTLKLGDIVLTPTEEKIGNSHCYRTHRKYANSPAVVRHLPQDFPGHVRLSIDDGDCLWPLHWLTLLSKTDHIRYGNRIRREVRFNVGDKVVAGRPLDSSDTNNKWLCFYGAEGTIVGIDTTEERRKLHGGKALAHVEFDRDALKSQWRPSLLSKKLYWDCPLECLEPVAVRPARENDAQTFTPLVVKATTPDQESKKPMTIKIPLPSLPAVALCLCLALLAGVIGVGVTGGLSYEYKIQTVKPLNSDGLLYIKTIEEPGYVWEWFSKKPAVKKYLRMGNVSPQWYYYETQESLGGNQHSKQLEKAYKRYTMASSVEAFEATQKQQQKEELIQANTEHLRQAAQKMKQLEESFPEE